MKNKKIKKILIVVDYQEDFANPKGKLYVPNAEKIADNIQKHINNKEYQNIIYTFDTHNKKDYENSEESKLFPFIHCEYGTKGWELYNINPLNNDEFKKTIKNNQIPIDFSINNEYFFVKDEFNIWTGNKNYENFITNLLKEMTIDDSEVEMDFCGVAEDVCISLHILGFLQRNYKVNILKDAVKGINIESTLKNIKEIQDLGVLYK